VLPARQDRPGPVGELVGEGHSRPVVLHSRGQRGQALPPTRRLLFWERHERSCSLPKPRAPILISRFPRPSRFAGRRGSVLAAPAPPSREIPAGAQGGSRAEGRDQSRGRQGPIPGTASKRSPGFFSRGACWSSRSAASPGRAQGSSARLPCRLSNRTSPKSLSSAASSRGARRLASRGHRPGGCGRPRASKQRRIWLTRAARRLTQRSRTRCQEGRSNGASVLMGTQRRFGRPTASASRKSFLFVLAEGLTDGAGLESTSGPYSRRAHPRKWAPRKLPCPPNRRAGSP
jgi:hypothetical protein